MRSQGIIVFFLVIALFAVYFMHATGTGLFAEPKTLRVCDEWGTEQYIRRAPSIGLPMGESGAPIIGIPLGDDVIRERDVCISYKEIPNPDYVEKEN